MFALYLRELRFFRIFVTVFAWNQFLSLMDISVWSNLTHVACRSSSLHTIDVISWSLLVDFFSTFCRIFGNWECSSSSYSFKYWGGFIWRLARLILNWNQYFFPQSINSKLFILARFHFQKYVLTLLCTQYYWSKWPY